MTLTDKLAVAINNAADLDAASLVLRAAMLADESDVSDEDFDRLANLVQSRFCTPR